MSFANLKKNKANALQALQSKVQASAAGEGSGNKNKDPRKWKLSYDKSTKKGSATIRFLPFGNGDRLPWVEWIYHSFEGKGGNYWNRSLVTLGQNDPVAELNKLQWTRGEGGARGADETAVRGRGRKLRYMANIVVISDPEHPENNGKNFIYEYGPAIHKTIMAAMVPEYADQSAVAVFDMWEGATFKIRTKDKAGFLNYDDSCFDAPAALHQDDNVLETIYNGMIDLGEFESEANYKSYDELTIQLKKVLGATYVGSLTGEVVNAQQAAESGGNPFASHVAQQQAAPVAQQQAAPVNNDPFGQKAPSAELDGDPFATVTAQPAAQQATADPFASAQPATNADPFAGAASVSNDDDPFASLGL